MFCYFRKERNILEAAASGASSAIMLVANVAANLIAFLAMLAFVNAALGWFGSMVDHPELSFQVGHLLEHEAFLIFLMMQMYLYFVQNTDH